MDLTKANPTDTDQVKGQIVISLLSRDQHNSFNSHSNSAAPVQTVVDALGNVAPPLGNATAQQAATPGSPAPLPAGRIDLHLGLHVGVEFRHLFPRFSIQDGKSGGRQVEGDITSIPERGVVNGRGR